MKQEMQRKRPPAAAKEESNNSKAATSSSKTSGGSDGGGARKDYWLSPGLVVKVMNKKVGEGRFYKAKGTVLEVIERYVPSV